MLDVDHFKRWNDSWGHLLGDELLRSLGEQIRLQLRDSDIPCRYGGEEFCIILPHTESHAAVQIAERLREAVAALRFEPREGLEAGISISLGVAQLEPDDDMYGLITRSDRALYLAKQQGRNRCVLAGEGE
jgi:diguanylate cyclase (GGDEF)-like protein